MTVNTRYLGKSRFGSQVYISLSFGIPHIGAIGGVNVTARYNPPEDNGFKVRDQ